MLFKLYKKAYNLNIEEKEYLLENFDSIVDILTAKKKKEKKVIRQTNWYIDHDKGGNVYPTDVRDGLFEEVTVSKKKEELVKQSNVHDPETKEEMLKTLSLLEKFVENDKDFSYDNISIFLHPLSKGSKKRILRPLKVVGLIRKMKNLSKRFNRNLENKNKLKVISKEFLNNLELVKSKLSHEEPQKKMAVLTLDKMAQVGYNAQEVAKNAYKLMVEHGWNSDEVMRFIFSSNISVNANKEPFLEAFQNLSD